MHCILIDFFYLFTLLLGHQEDSGDGEREKNGRQGDHGGGDGVRCGMRETVFWRALITPLSPASYPSCRNFGS